jgi:SOS-response transcriptional repressor LexA
MLEDRPSKKQRELLSFIEGFIKGNGYGPSYREIMRALDYRSVSTVAVHVNGLITRGLLRKEDNSARSLEIVSTELNGQDSRKVHIDWLQYELKKRQDKATAGSQQEALVLDEALKILQRDDNL